MSDEPAADTAPDTAPADAAEPTAAPEPEPTEAEAPAAVADPETPAADAPVEPEADAEPADPVPEPSKKKWYVVKVASGREESIKAAIERMVKIEGLEVFFGQIVIPVERITEVKKVTETKNGQKVTKEKRVVKEKKKFPGYLMAEVEWTPDLQALFRDTSGVGDFVGSTGPGKEPAPMSDRDVQSMLYGMLPDDKKGDYKPKQPDRIKLDYEVGDKVRIREGAFANFEGEVTNIQLPKEAGETPKVTVKVMVLGRQTPLELEYWQVDKV
jgi:transcriptional antiterminator NusG